MHHGHELGHSACLGPCCMSKSKLRVHVHAACLSLYCESMSMLHDLIHEAYPCSYYKCMSLLHDNDHDACPCSYCKPCLYCVYVSMLYVCVHAACPVYSVHKFVVSPRNLLAEHRLCRQRLARGYGDEEKQGLTERQRWA
jgi:hypothetical protein